MGPAAWEEGVGQTSAHQAQSPRSSCARSERSSPNSDGFPGGTDPAPVLEGRLEAQYDAAPDGSAAAYVRLIEAVAHLAPASTARQPGAFLCPGLGAE